MHLQSIPKLKHRIWQDHPRRPRQPAHHALRIITTNSSSSNNNKLPFPRLIFHHGHLITLSHSSIQLSPTILSTPTHHPQQPTFSIHHHKPYAFIHHRHPPPSVPPQTYTVTIIITITTVPSLLLSTVKPATTSTPRRRTPLPHTPLSLRLDHRRRHFSATAAHRLRRCYQPIHND